MQPLLAEIHTEALASDARRAPRRTLRLQVAVATEAGADALIHNLSETGLLLETTTDFARGDALDVELPHVGATSAIVAWSRGGFVGCEFVTPVSKAVVSAALLKAPVELPDLPAAAARPRLWSDLDDEWAEADAAEASQPVLIISLTMALLMTLVFLIALLTFPFAR